jgi:peroxiredoxin
VAESPDDIQPLRTGDSIPAVTVTTVAGDDFDLAAVVAEQPTVLIFYRGGW